MHLVASGSSYECWQGSGGSMRLDWTRNGHVRSIVVGHGHAAYAAPQIRRWTDSLALLGKVSIWLDLFEVESYDSAFRIDQTSWAIAHRAELACVKVVARSRLVNRALQVANLGLGGVIERAEVRERFDRECMARGLPPAPPVLVAF